MKRDRKWFMTLVVGMVATACSLEAYQNSDDGNWEEEEENKPLSETWSAVPEDFYCLNVAYYVPADLDTLMLWHKRLSGITIHTQEFFEENMARYGYEKTFGLVINDSNQNYVDMDYIKSALAVSKLQEGDVMAMAEEVLAYYAANPDRKLSDHFLVYLPEYEGSFLETVYVDGDGDGKKEQAITFAGVDTEKFDPKFLESTRGRQAYLSKLGQVMYEETHNFFLGGNSNSGLDSWYSLSGISRNGSKLVLGHSYYAGDMTKVRLTEIDAVQLNGVQVFNTHDGYVDTPMEEVNITRVDFDWKEDEDWLYVYEKDSLVVGVEFEDTGNIAGVIMYIDPWLSAEWTPDLGSGIDATAMDSLTNIDANSATMVDAMSYYLPAADFVSTNRVEFVVRWSDFSNLGTAGTWTGSTRKWIIAPENGLLGLVEAYKRGEVRFRFVTLDGKSYPDPMVSQKGEWGTMYRHYFHIQYWTNNDMWNLINFYMPDLESRYPDGVTPEDLEQ